MRDLAAATALDARLARFSLVASDLEAALAAGVAPARSRFVNAPRGGARALSADLQAARAEVELAAEAIGNPADRPQATRAAAAARAYAGKLTAALGGDPSAAAPDIIAARDALATAISEFRASRSRWRLDAPEPQGVEGEFADARREVERAESAVASRRPVADPAAGRAGAMAVGRARAAAERLPPTLRDPAVRWAAAQERALEAVNALAGAPASEGPALARRYHAAKADALAALADYFAALAAR